MNPDRLRMYVFPLSLTGAARKWWVNEGEGKITTWVEITENFFCKYYPLSRVGKNTMVSGEMDDGLYYLEFMNWLSSKFRKHKKMNVVTKNALWDFWLKCGDDEELEDDIESSESELEESDYESHHNSTTDSFFKPYLDAQEKRDICAIEKRHAHNQKDHDCDIGKFYDISVRNGTPLDDKKGELINARVCMAEKFEVMKYSLRPNEEYIAISTRECDTWKRNKESLSHIYQESFVRKIKGRP
ncbi:hypothetical protein Tco_1328803 [Tanacetum coccineum]